MRETHNLQRTVLLPRRLADRIALTGADRSDAPASTKPNTFGLTGRIRSLPGVRPEHAVLASGALTTDYFVEASYMLRRACTTPQLLCHIDGDGILIPEISPLDRDEVLQKGWASSAADVVNLYLPRDNIEMEIAWRIVLMAYQFLTSSPAGASGHRHGKPALPLCASTARYWM